MDIGGLSKKSRPLREIQLRRFLHSFVIFGNRDLGHSMFSSVVEAIGALVSSSIESRHRKPLLSLHWKWVEHHGTF
jgi:hypothetical protein